MCGRYTLKTPAAEWAQLLLPIMGDASLSNAISEANLEGCQPRYNIAPTQSILAFAAEPETGLRCMPFRWGLIPPWAADLTIGNRMINARSETVADKRSFSGPLKSRRCLVLADGYYEWQKVPGQAKQPFWIAPHSGGLMLLAGLWETNRKATGELVRSCTLLTTAANAALHPIHDRMPVVLQGQGAGRWLAQDCGPDEARSLLGPAEDNFFLTLAVSTFVNNARNEGSACLEPAAG